MEINIAAAQSLLHVDGIGWLIEQIFSGLQRAAMPEVAPKNESLFAADYSGRLEFEGDAARGVSGMQHHKGLRCGLDGNEQYPGEPSAEGKRRNKNEPEESAHDGDSLDDRGRMAQNALVRL
jgi:hypothetical protein